MSLAQREVCHAQTGGVPHRGRGAGTAGIALSPKHLHTWGEGKLWSLFNQNLNQDWEKMRIFPTVEQTGAFGMGGSNLMP